MLRVSRKRLKPSPECRNCCEAQLQARCCCAASSQQQAHQTGHTCLHATIGTRVLWRLLMFFHVDAHQHRKRHNDMHHELWDGLKRLGLQSFVEKDQDRLATVNTIKVGLVLWGFFECYRSLTAPCCLSVEDLDSHTSQHPLHNMTCFHPFPLSIFVSA